MDTWNDEYRMGEPAAVYQVAEVKERVNPETPLLEKGDEIIDMGADFDFDVFQVVCREFFAHLSEPAVTFNNCRFYVNSACLNKFPDTNYVQVLVNRNTKIMALRPCVENARDSFVWCSVSKGKRKSTLLLKSDKNFFPNLTDKLGILGKLFNILKSQ